jgi:hypothetical protein
MVSSGLIAKLQNFLPHLFCMYELIKNRGSEPTLLELEIMQATRRMDNPDVVQYFSNMPGSGNLAAGHLPVCISSFLCSVHSLKYW